MVEQNEKSEFLHSNSHGIKEALDAFPKDTGEKAASEQAARKLDKASGKDRQRPKRQPKARAPAAAPRIPDVGTKGMGFVKHVKDNYGFIGCPEWEGQLFFHASEVVKPEDVKGNTMAYFKDNIAAGDEVEFVVGLGKRRSVGLQIRKLAMNTVKAQLLSEDRYAGVVSKELGSGQWRSEASSSGRITYHELAVDGTTQGEQSIDFMAEDVHNLRRALKKGTLVEFSICTDNQTRAQKAVHIELKGAVRNKATDLSRNGTAAESGETQGPSPQLLHGFVKTFKPSSGGSIRCIEQQRRFSFSMANIPVQHQQKLEVGSEVLFNVMTDSRGNDSVISLAILPPGSLPEKQTSSERKTGRVVRPFSETGPVDGLILLNCQSQVRFQNGQLEGSSEDASTLKIEDEVELCVLDDFKADKRYASSLKLVARAEEKRELGQRSGQIFFHFSSLQGCKPQDLSKNDDVEFSVAKDPEHGTVATRVRRVPAGTAVFETVSSETYEGFIVTPMYNISPQVLSSGVISYEVDGSPSKILFGEKDFKDTLQAGDLVSFQIADNVKAAKQAEKLGSTVSRLVGKRATNGKRLRLQGTVKSTNGSSGFVKYLTKAGTEKRAGFHTNDVAEHLTLSVDDEVAFDVSQNQKTRHFQARNIVRIKEAAEKAAEIDEAATTAAAEKTERRSAIKPVNNAANAPPSRPTPAMPDGTRGFTMGRGGPLKQPGNKHPGLVNGDFKAPGKVPNGCQGQLNGLESGLGKVPFGPSQPIVGAHDGEVQEDRIFPEASMTTQPIAIAKRSIALNPAAANFTPKSLSTSLQTSGSQHSVQ